jgi:hypothetical protein
MRFRAERGGLLFIGLSLCVALFLVSGAAMPAESGVSGIGVELKVEEGTGRCLITKIYPGGPAERAGLRVGDYISEVDGKQVRGMTLEQVVATIRGKKGTTVRITIEGKSTIALVRQDLSGLVASEKTQAVRCPKCASASPSGAKFCSKCGAAIVAEPKLCGACGAAVAPGAKFCGPCGSSRTPAAAKEKGGDSTYEHIIAIYQKGLDVLEAHYQELASIVTTNREKIRAILDRLDSRIENLEEAVRLTRDLIEKAKSAEYIIADEPPKAIPKFEFYTDYNRPAENRSYAEAQTRYLIERGASYVGKIENIIERYRNLRSYYVNQLASGQTAAGAGGSSGSETPSHGGGSGDIVYLLLKDGRPKIYWATEDHYYRDRYVKVDPDNCKVEYAPDPKHEEVNGRFRMSWDKLPSTIGKGGVEWRFSTEIVKKPKGNDGCGIKFHSP